MKKRNGITNRGIIWELANSIWIAFTFTAFLNWAAFLYIGIRTKQRKWKLWGAFYLMIEIICMIMSDSSTKNSSVAVEAYMVICIISIVHAFLARKEFLIRLEMLKDGNVRQQENDQLRQRIQQEYGIREPKESVRLSQAESGKQAFQPEREESSFVRTASEEERFVQTADYSARIAPEKVRLDQTENRSDKAEPKWAEQSGQIQREQSHLEVSEELLDVNLCTAEELAKLPGISIVMAKKAVAHRQESGGFSNVEDFLNFIALKPHFVVQVRDRLTCTLKSDRFERKTESTGRILDF